MFRHYPSLPLPTKAFTIALFAFAFATSALAQSPEVKVTLTGQRVLSENGKETFASAEKAGPGDIVQYEAVYRNEGKAAARSVVATVPIPAAMALVADSAQPAAPEASLDGKTFSPTPLTREVKNAAGALEKQPVPLAEYRALRWSIAELAPAATATFRLRAQVSANLPAK